MKDYELKGSPETASNHDIVWAFDLGKGSIGEAVRRGTEFLHKASLLIPAEFAETKTAAGRRRMWRTRQAHKAREEWLEKVMREAGMEVLKGRQVGKVDEQGNEIPKEKWKSVKGEWKTKIGDYRLEREFPPRKLLRNKDGKFEPVIYPDGKAKDGAPAKTDADFSICYNSALLRIKLLRGNADLKEWQIFKALHAAIQKRGYERVPWATKEAGRQGMSLAELEQKEREDLAKKEPKYQATLTAWKTFVLEVLNGNGLSHEKYAFPCYYDAWKMGLWKPEQPDNDSTIHLDHKAQSTRNVRFDRKYVEREIFMLAANADKLLKGKLGNAHVALLEKFKREKLERVNKTNERRDAKNATLPPEKRKKHLDPPSFEHMATSAGEFLLFGPAGQPPEEAKNDFSKYLAFRRNAGLRPGTEDDWNGALGQKIPRFDNRIIEKCALIPRLNVCKAGAKPNKNNGAPDPETLLNSEAAFLMKLKNVRVMPNVRPLTAQQIALLLAEKRKEIASLALDPANSKNAKRIAKCYSYSAAQWKKLGKQPMFGFEPHPDFSKIELLLPLPDTMKGFPDAFERQLREMRVLRAESVESLTANQIGKLLDMKRKELQSICLDPEDPKYADIVAKVYSYENEKAWAEIGLKAEFGFWPAPNHEIIEAPKSGGRSRFSRPALRLLRALILSGEKPSRFRQLLIDRHEAILAKLEYPRGQSFVLFRNCKDTALTPYQRNKVDEENGRKGLLDSDLDFLLKMRKADAADDSWDDLFIPNEKLDSVVEDIRTCDEEKSLSEMRQEIAQRQYCPIETKNTCRICASQRAICKLIGEQNDPIVRQRLNFFWQRVQELEMTPDPDGKPIGAPARVILEFAREDFLGKKAKESWKAFNKKKREQNQKAAEHGGNEREQLKFKLWQDQGGECVYGIPAKATKEGECVYKMCALPSPGTPGWEMLEIDHIVPQADGGPNAYVNWVLTFGEIANGVKSKMTPYDWFKRDRPKELDGYIEFVRNKIETKDKPGLSRKKIALLTRPDAKDLVQKYTALAETAWISRLAQTIIRLHFGWPLDHQKGEERVLTLTGGQTADFRRRFRLNTLLGANAKTMESASDISKADEEKIANEIQDNLMTENRKNRVDPRHHALDAMVLTLIPEWRHYQAKNFERWRARGAKQDVRLEIMGLPTPFFDASSTLAKGKLNYDAVRQKFRDVLAQTHAKLVAFQRPKLEQTHYARKRIESQICYVKREELRLMAYDVKGKPDIEFRMSQVRDDLEMIDAERPGMQQLKVDLGQYVDANPSATEKNFTAWLAARCHQLPGKKIQMQPLASPGEEADSKRRGESKTAESFGRIKHELKFNPKRVAKRYRKIRDRIIRDLIAKRFDIQGEGKKTTCPDFTRDQWESFCAELRMPTKHGGVGPRVLKVSVLAGNTEVENDDSEDADLDGSAETSIESSERKPEVLARDEYLPSQKSKSNKAFLKGESHKGYFLYLDDAGKPQRLPVYAHESFEQIRKLFEATKKELSAKEGTKFREVGFLRTGCTVELTNATSQKVSLKVGKTKQVVSLPKGLYRMNTLGDNNRMKLTTQNGSVADGQVGVFIEAGLRRVD